MGGDAPSFGWLCGPEFIAYRPNQRGSCGPETNAGGADSVGGSDTGMFRQIDSLITPVSPGQSVFSQPRGSQVGAGQKMECEVQYLLRGIAQRQAYQHAFDVLQAVFAPDHLYLGQRIADLHFSGRHAPAPR